MQKRYLVKRPQGSSWSATSMELSWDFWYDMQPEITVHGVLTAFAMAWFSLKRVALLKSSLLSGGFMYFIFLLILSERNPDWKRVAVPEKQQSSITQR